MQHEPTRTSGPRPSANFPRLADPPSHEDAPEAGVAPRLLCVAGSDRDRDELALMLSNRDPRGATHSITLETLAMIGPVRRAVLLAPDALAAVLAGRTGWAGTGTEVSSGLDGRLVEVTGDAATGPAADAAGTTIDDVAAPMSPSISPPLSFDHVPPPPAPGGSISSSSFGTARRRETDPSAELAAEGSATTVSDEDRRVLDLLTPREREVAAMVGNGKNVAEIARSLGRAKTTVISHRRSLLRKIKCRDALGIARFSYRAGLSDP